MNIGEILNQRPGQGFNHADLLTVVSLGDDPRSVVVSDGNPGAERPVPCMASYSPRLVGDKVLAAQLSGGTWLVLGRVGAPSDALTGITTGVGSPSGGGWRQGAATWVREDGNGSRSFYIDVTGAIPQPATVPSVDGLGWLANTTTTYVTPRQGAVSATSGDTYGAWFYGGAISAACAGKTVTGMTVRVARDSGGLNGLVPVSLGLHTSTGLAPTITNQWSTGIVLARNGSAVIPIPATQRNLLATGSAFGVACWGSEPNEYATYTKSADITITFG